jgi:TRAP-type C4-dicarboxylate transport system permease small subunit
VARLAELALALLVAVALFALMMLTCVDVIGRYWFSAPVPGASELTQFGMGIIVFGALPLVSGHGGHITIGLMEMITADRLALLQRLVMAVTATAALAVMGWRLLITGSDLASYGDTSSYLRIPLAPIAYFMAVMAFAGALAALVHFFAGSPDEDDVRHPLWDARE